MDPKNPLNSKTLWANAIGLAALLFGYLVDHNACFKDAIPAAFYPTVSALLVAVNTILRFVTKEPIKF